MGSVSNRQRTAVCFLILTNPYVVCAAFLETLALMHAWSLKLLKL
jgi:hypothetical protein